MTELAKKYLKGDKILWGVFIGLCILSLLFMFSASSTLAFKNEHHTVPVLRHLFFLVVGVGIAFVVHLLPQKAIRMAAYVGVVFSIITLLLLLVTTAGVTVNEAKRWIEIFGIQFQPSEIAKLSLLVLAADMIARTKQSEHNEKIFFRIIVILSCIICALILPENLSTAVMLFFVVFVMMFVGKIKGKKLLLLVGCGIALLLVMYGTSKLIPGADKMPLLDRVPVWETRIVNMFKKEENLQIKDANFQEMHAKIAVARGGFFGVMPGNSVQRDFLPLAYSDFIFSIIIEEIGLLGGIVVIILYLTLLFRAGRIAQLSRTQYSAMVVFGLSFMLVFQAFVSIAVSTTWGPVTGQPLPLISRGGTSILISSIYFGIMLGVSRQIKEENAAADMLEVSEEEGITADEET